MADIRPEYITLWVQTVVYFGLAVWVYKEKLKTGTCTYLSVPEVKDKRSGKIYFPTFSATDSSEAGNSITFINE